MIICPVLYAEQTAACIVDDSKYGTGNVGSHDITMRHVVGNETPSGSKQSLVLLVCICL